MEIAPWLLFVHVVGAVAWVGGGLMLMAVGMAALRSGDPGSASAFGRTLGWVGPRIFTPAVVLVAITGPWIVLTSSAWDFAQLWVIVGVACFVLAFAVGVAFVARTGIAMSRPQIAADEARTLLRRWLSAYVAVVVILLIALWDMVVKPGL